MASACFSKATEFLLDDSGSLVFPWFSCWTVNNEMNVINNVAYLFGSLDLLQQQGKVSKLQPCHCWQHTSSLSILTLALCPQQILKSGNI